MNVNIKNINLTENMKHWLRELYLEAAEDARGAASNSHTFALGSVGEEAVLHEQNAEESREYALILEKMARELEYGFSFDARLADATERSVATGNVESCKDEFVKE